MYHNFFIHSSVDGHLGCFNVLVIVNSAAMNNGMHASFQFWFPQDICPVVELLGHGDQPWVFFGRNDANAETSVL